MNRQPAGSPIGGQFASDSHAKNPVVIESTGLTDEEYDIKWQKFRMLFETGAYKWRDAGFTPDEAAQWYVNLFTTVKEASKWRMAGFKPDEAKQWRDTGFGSLHTAHNWHKVGLAPDEAAKWRKNRVDPGSAYRLHQSGFAPGEEWGAVGIAPEEAERWSNRFWYALAVRWYEQGFAVDEAEEWADHGFGPEKAADWRDHGYGPDEAVEWIANGVDNPRQAW